MKARLIPVVSLLLASLAPACETLHECTLIGCSDGVGMTLPALATTYSGNLPLTIDACLGAECSVFRIDHTGAAPVCTSMSAGNTLCTIDGMGTVVLTKLPLPTGATDGPLPVHVTVTDKSGATIADGTATVTITPSQPNGPDCEPTCHEGQVSLTL